MKPKQPLLKRLLRGATITLLAIAVLLYIVLPVGMGVFALLPGREAAGSAPEGYQAVTLVAEDGVEVQSIGGLGIHAMIADGATRRSTEELLALPSERPLVRNFTARVMFAAVQLLSGESPPKPLLNAMLASQSTRFLLIAVGRNELETSFNQLFAGALGSRANVWIAPETGHTGAFSRYPQEYEQRVIEFFDAALLAPG